MLSENREGTDFRRLPWELRFNHDSPLSVILGSSPGMTATKSALALVDCERARTGGHEEQEDEAEEDRSITAINGGE